jgi:hypothetical protein
MLNLGSGAVEMLRMWKTYAGALEGAIKSVEEATTG